MGHGKSVVPEGSCSVQAAQRLADATQRNVMMQVKSQRTWDPGAFKTCEVDGTTGKFLAVWSVMVIGACSSCLDLTDVKLLLFSRELKL